MVALAYMESARVMRETPAEYTTGSERPSYSALPHALILDRTIHDGAKLTYAVLQMHWWQGGECHVSNVVLCEELGCSDSQLRRNLKELERAGWITARYRGEGQGKAYAPTMPLQADGQAFTGERFNRSRMVGSESNRSPVTPQPFTGDSFNRSPVTPLPIKTPEDSPKEEDTGGVVAADAAPPPPTEKRPKKFKPAATACPDEFVLTDRHLEYAAGLGFDPQQAQALTDAFLSHHRFKGTRGVDWYAGWQGWLRREVTYSRERSQRPGAPAKNAAAPQRKISEGARRAATEWESL